MSILRILTNLCVCNKTRCKNKKHFCRYCLQCFSSERVLVEHKETCLKINGKQSVKLRSGSIKFKIHFRQLQKKIQKNNATYTEKYQAHIPCSFAYKVVCVDDTFSEPVILYRGKNAINRFMETIDKEHDSCN